MAIADTEINFDQQEGTYSIVRFFQGAYQGLLAALGLLAPASILFIVIFGAAPSDHANQWRALLYFSVAMVVTLLLAYVIALGALRLRRIVLVPLLLIGIAFVGFGTFQLVKLVLPGEPMSAEDLSPPDPEDAATPPWSSPPDDLPDMDAISDDVGRWQTIRLYMGMVVPLLIGLGLVAALARSIFLSRRQLFLFKEIVDSRSVWGLVTHGLGRPMPGMARRSKRLRTTIAVLLYFLGNALLGLGFIWLVFMLVPFHFSGLSITVGGWNGGVANTWSNIFVSYVVVVIVFLLGGRLIGMAQGLSVVTAKESQLSDPRPPVLFLRAFGDDQVPLRDTAPLSLRVVLGLGRPKASLDLELVTEGRHYGPVVALGSPKDKLPPFGAARDYFEGATWQAAVSDMTNRASAIVICLDDTDGILVGGGSAFCRAATCQDAVSAASEIHRRPRQSALFGGPRVTCDGPWRRGGPGSQEQWRHPGLLL